MKSLPLIQRLVDPDQWHQHVVGGLNRANKSRASLLENIVVQKPVQLGLNILAIGTGAAAMIREIIYAVGQLLAMSLTLTVGLVRVLTWSQFAEKLYQRLPGPSDLVLTARRANNQAAGLFFSALGALFFFAHGGRFNVNKQLRLGNYGRPSTVPPLEVVKGEVKVKLAKQPALVQQPEPTPLVHKAFTEPAAEEVIKKAITTPKKKTALVVPPPLPLPNSDPLLEVYKQRIAGYGCALKALAVPSAEALGERVEAMQGFKSKPVDAQRLSQFEYQVKKAPTADTMPNFLSELALSSASIVVTLANPSQEKGEAWWKKCQMSQDVGSGMTLTWIETRGGLLKREIIPADATSKDQRIVQRFFVLRDADGKIVRQITQFHFQNWNLDAAPDPKLFQELLSRVNRHQPIAAKAPIVITCQEGGSRSAAFIAAHSLQSELAAKVRAKLPHIRVNIEKHVSQKMYGWWPEMRLNAPHLQAVYQLLTDQFNPPPAPPLADRIAKWNADYGIPSKLSTAYSWTLQPIGSLGSWAWSQMPSFPAVYAPLPL